MTRNSEGMPQPDPEQRVLYERLAVAKARRLATNTLQHWSMLLGCDEAAISLVDVITTRQLVASIARAMNCADPSNANWIQLETPDFGQVRQLVEDRLLRFGSKGKLWVLGEDASSTGAVEVPTNVILDSWPHLISLDQDDLMVSSPDLEHALVLEWQSDLANRHEGVAFYKLMAR